MAQKIDVHLKDDLDELHDDDTTVFDLYGRSHKIDLSAANTEKLREALRPYAATGRQAARTRPDAGDDTSIGDSRIDPATVRFRAGAKVNGHRVMF